MIRFKIIILTTNFVLEDVKFRDFWFFTYENKLMAKRRFPYFEHWKTKLLFTTSTLYSSRGHCWIDIPVGMHTSNGGRCKNERDDVIYGFVWIETCENTKDRSRRASAHYCWLQHIHRHTHSLTSKKKKNDSDINGRDFTGLNTNVSRKQR